MQMCDHEIDVYLDYRWLPENTKPFGREMARRAGLSEKTWYCQNINRWIGQEMKRKIKAWQRGLA